MDHLSHFFNMLTTLLLRFYATTALGKWVNITCLNTIQIGEKTLRSFRPRKIDHPCRVSTCRCQRPARCHGSSVWNASMSRAGPRNTGNRSPVRVRFWVELQFPAETKVRQWLGETGAKTLHFWMLVMYNLHPCDQINFWIPVVTSMGVGVDNGWWKWPRLTIWGKNPASNNGFSCWIFPLHNYSCIVMHPLYGIVAK